MQTVSGIIGNYNTDDLLRCTTRLGSQRDMPVKRPTGEAELLIAYISVPANP